MCEPVKGTLVLAIPTVGGLIFAADSRSAVGSAYNDGTYKIKEALFPKRTAFAVTGNGEFVARPTAAVDLNEYIRTAPKVFSLGTVVTDYLNESKQDQLTPELVRDTERACIQALLGWNEFQSVGKSFASKDLCVVVFGSFDPSSGSSIASFFKIAINNEGRPFIGDRSFDVIKLSDPIVVFPYGVTDYFWKNVWHGMGREFLSPALSFAHIDRKVADVSVEEGLASAVDFIQATSKMMDIIPDEYKVGGPADVVLLCSDERPRRLMWK